MKLSLTYPLMIALLSACASPPVTLLGEPATATATTQTIVLQPTTRWVNVTGGDTVRFLVGDKAFAWNFNVATSVRSFDLARVAPPGMLNHSVIAYIKPDPRYIGGRGGLGGLMMR